MMKFSYHSFYSCFLLTNSAGEGEVGLCWEDDWVTGSECWGGRESPKQVLTSQQSPLVSMLQSSFLIFLQLLQILQFSLWQPSHWQSGLPCLAVTPEPPPISSLFSIFLSSELILKCRNENIKLQAVSVNSFPSLFAVPLYHIPYTFTFQLFHAHN